MVACLSEPIQVLARIVRAQNHMSRVFDTILTVACFHRMRVSVEAGLLKATGMPGAWLPVIARPCFGVAQDWCPESQLQHFGSSCRMIQQVSFISNPCRVAFFCMTSKGQLNPIRLCSLQKGTSLSAIINLLQAALVDGLLDSAVMGFASSPSLLSVLKCSIFSQPTLES